MGDLIELAKRVEGLTGPDREVDGLIACAIFKTVTTDDDLIYLSPICKSDECAPGTYWLVQRSGRSLQTAPTYTASLDAAMSLVLNGAWMTLDRYSVSTNPIDPFAWRVWIKYFAGDVEGDGPCWVIDNFANSSSAALALTSAALRAIASQKAPRHD